MARRTARPRVLPAVLLVTAVVGGAALLSGPEGPPSGAGPSDPKDVDVARDGGVPGDAPPARAHAVPSDVATLLRDDGPFGALAEEVRRDVEDDLRRGSSGDEAGRLAALELLTSIALLQGRLEDALELSREVRELQPVPERRLLTGVLVRPLVAAKRDRPEHRRATLARELRRELAALPYEHVSAELKTQMATLEVESDGLLVGLAERHLGGVVRGGRIPGDLARVVVEVGFVLREILPFREAVVEALRELVESHEGERSDIWAARSVELAGEPLHPVVVGIWDSGVDEALLAGRLWSNGREIPGNRRDDDGNGHADDVHGIAWSWRGEPEAGSLAPLPVAEAAAVRRDLQAFVEMEAGVQGPAALELRARLDAMPPRDVGRLLDQLELLQAHGHGSHVAGIAVAGNPAVRVLVVRMAIGIPRSDLATLEAWAHGHVRMIRSTVEYLVAARARVVNMSWSPSVRDIETALEGGADGLEAAERRLLARLWRQAIAEALRGAMGAAPDVLFVTVACDDAVAGDCEPRPSLPNLITVGAVDACGEEVAFLRRGSADVHANGFRVSSTLPGGELQAWTGTSMAAAQVTNLAAKLLARWPGLPAPEVRALILEGADLKPARDRALHLLNPARSFRLAASRWEPAGPDAPRGAERGPGARP